MTTPTPPIWMVATIYESRGGRKGEWARWAEGAEGARWARWADCRKGQDGRFEEQVLEGVKILGNFSPIIYHFGKEMCIFAEI